MLPRTMDHGPADMTATDIPGALAEHRRKLEALAAANQAVLDHAQAVAAANLAAMHQAVAELDGHLLQLEASEAGHVRAGRQVAMFKSALERAVANMEALRGLIHQAQASARLVMSQRVRDAMDEAQAMGDGGRR
jgi:hypothetical protein